MEAAADEARADISPDCNPFCDSTVTAWAARALVDYESSPNAAWPALPLFPAFPVDAGQLRQGQLQRLGAVAAAARAAERNVELVRQGEARHHEAHALGFVER